MNKLEVGTKVIVVGPELTGWTGVIVRDYEHVPHACCVDLDPEQEPSMDITGCYFEFDELEAL